MRKVKRPRPGLRPGRLGWALRCPLENGAACRLASLRELVELGPQGGVLGQEFLDPRFQCGEFREQRGDERHRLFAQPGEFFEGRHDADM